MSGRSRWNCYWEDAMLAGSQTNMQNMTVQRGGAALGHLLQAAIHSLVNMRRGKKNTSLITVCGEKLGGFGDMCKADLLVFIFYILIWTEELRLVLGSATGAGKNESPRKVSYCFIYSVTKIESQPWSGCSFR